MRSFRDKDEFIQLISEKWNIDVNGFDMLKKNLNEAQIEIDKNPNNSQLREHEVPLLKEYTLALEDEENLLFQKAEFLGGQKDKECLDLDVNMFINKINSQDAIKMIEEVTNRIKNVLDFVVHKNQSAFILDWQITENILLTQERLKGYDCAKGPKRCSMKIDIQKAYDTVNWKFLENALRLFGFHSKMVTWIIACITTPSYSICINGERNGFFIGGRGLRGAIEDVLHILPFKIGKLLVRYLGVPFVAKKIGVKDCKSLIDKVKSRINNWKNNSLPYAGKTQLITSVLASIQKWPAEWFLKYPILSHYSVPVLNNETDDKLMLMWKSNNGTEKDFSSSHVWKDMKTLNGNVQ
ncbi:hypothetical protein Tco_1473614 [Tanacetum coccineum]